MRLQEIWKGGSSYICYIVSRYEIFSSFGAVSWEMWFMLQLRWGRVTKSLQGIVGIKPTTIRTKFSFARQMKLKMKAETFKYGKKEEQQSQIQNNAHHDKNRRFTVPVKHNKIENRK